MSYLFSSILFHIGSLRVFILQPKIFTWNLGYWIEFEIHSIIVHYDGSQCKEVGTHQLFSLVIFAFNIKDKKIHTLIRLLLLLWIQHCELNRFQTKIQCIRCILHLIFWTTSKLTNATNTLWRQKCAITFLKNTKNEHFMLALIAV